MYTHVFIHTHLFHQEIIFYRNVAFMLVWFLRQYVVQISEVVNEPSDHPKSFDFFFSPNTAFSAQDTLHLALFCSWAIFVHMLLLLLTAFNTTLTMLCSSCFFHKQKLECLTQHRLLSSTLNPNMWTEAEKEWDEEKKQG